MSRILRCVWVAIVVGALGVGTAKPVAAQGTGALDGAVVDESGAAVAFAAVVLIDPKTDDVVARTTSGADGSFTFTGIAAGDYWLEFSRPGHETARLDVTVEATSPPDGGSRVVS